MRPRHSLLLIIIVVLTTTARGQSLPDSAIYPGASEGQTSYKRLADVAKFWAYVKFIHPRVHASGVDWDQAFTAAAPRVLQAKTDFEYAAAVEEMLAALHDPSTHVLAPAEPADPVAADGRIVLTTTNTGGVTVVTLETGTEAAATAASSALAGKLAGGTGVVFDLRGSKAAAVRIPSSFLVTRRAMIPAIPSLVSRVHSGYASIVNTYASYHSSWDMQPCVRVTISGIAPVHSVFLVNSSTSIP